MSLRMLTYTHRSSDYTSDQRVCFSFTGRAFDEALGFTDYDVFFASCTEPTTGTVFEEREPQAAPDLAPGQALADIQYEAFGQINVRQPGTTLDVDFELAQYFGSMIGVKTKQGRSIFELDGSAGSSATCNSGMAGFESFNEAAIKTEGGGGGGTSPENPYGDGSPGCKDRAIPFILADPSRYKAYKLCDDEACSGAGVCAEHMKDCFTGGGENAQSEYHRPLRLSEK